MTKTMFAGLALAAVLAVNTNSAFALTAAETVKACAADYQTQKAANKLPVGATWPSFEKDCIAKMNAAAAAPAAKGAAPAAMVKPVVPAAPAAMVKPVVPAAPAALVKPVVPVAPAAMAKSATPAVAPTAPATGGVAGEQSRIKLCGVEWAAYKTSAKRDPEMTWPKFWSDCNTRMKAAGK